MLRERGWKENKRLAFRHDKQNQVAKFKLGHLVSAGQ